MSDNTHTFSTRVPKDDAEEIGGYVEENGLSKSEGIRKLATSGLEYEEWGGRDRRERLERRVTKLKEQNSQLNERVDDFRRMHSHPGDEIAQGAVWVAMALFFAAIAVSTVWEYGTAPIDSGTLLLLSLAAGLIVVLAKMVTYVLKFTGWRLSNHIPKVNPESPTADPIEDPIQE